MTTVNIVHDEETINIDDDIGTIGASEATGGSSGAIDLLCLSLFSILDLLRLRVYV